MEKDPSDRFIQHRRPNTILFYKIFFFHSSYVFFFKFHFIQQYENFADVHKACLLLCCTHLWEYERKLNLLYAFIKQLIYI